MIFTYMCKTCGCSSRSRDFGTIERFVEPCILLLLSKESAHGYGLLEGLETHCGEKVDVGDLYRTLRRMEHDGWVTSVWDKKNVRDKRVYTITKEGHAFLKHAVASLKQTDELIHHLFSGYQKVYPDSNAI
ncbi:MAG: PadR-like protein family transcriptional regulator [Candidatus Roizmanbacteria bacterium GW2011_GWB1_40_7]|uniref:PadR-like protein family transcriptional regulator n=3 Tax=Candidatus Roizmaniibacteriota TaxID=1752723 RepID=A0A0G0XB26_9BACT|nr:MAG: PadR-like protein family transcriptional regulator [Candidatus Roizmanbacteria bacterium GW2011_GWB1_40_7]KKR92076.1 MAG: PadR-like protein family transcriptional regulator [Candidatus Roizmanbacteria bacterium GW2011_GWA1_41_13]KKS22154.1 MAG: PadR-like protein family transcriptional regulator [Candidatus Roizmanbacteria bacterium GW2011_GWC2_41_7]